MSGTLTTTAIAQNFSGSSSNQLQQSEQGVSVIAATGTRTFTNLASNVVTVQSVTGLAPTGSFVGNGNMV